MSLIIQAEQHTIKDFYSVEIQKVRCLRTLENNSSKDQENIRQSLGFECADCSVLLLCALVMLKRERAGTGTVEIAVFFFVSPQKVRVSENQVSRPLSAANTACNIGRGITTAM